MSTSTSTSAEYDRHNTGPNSYDLTLEKAFIGRVVTFAQSIHDDHYLCDPGRDAQVITKQKDYTDIPFQTDIKFIVHEAKLRYTHDYVKRGVVLECQNRRNHYLGAELGKHRTRDLDLYTEHHGNPPLDKPHCVFTIEPVGPLSDENKSFCAIRSYQDGFRFVRYNTNGLVTGSQEFDNYCKWYGVAGSGGPIRDGYKLISSLDNRQSSSKGALKYKKTIGVSTTNSKSAAKEAHFDYEISANFSAGPASIGGGFKVGMSLKWETSSSKTWSEAEETEADAEVNPGQFLGIYQLQGEYGKYKCGSSHFQFRDIKDQDPEALAAELD